jgi:hypothetical protein
MTDDQSTPRWPPAIFAEQFRQASEEITDQQLRFYNELLSAGTGRQTNGLADIGAASTETAVFKTRVQSGGRLSIPDAEREAVGIEEGDLVQAFVIPITQTHSDSHE